MPGIHGLRKGYQTGGITQDQRLQPDYIEALLPHHRLAKFLEVQPIEINEIVIPNSAINRVLLSLFCRRIMELEPGSPSSTSLCTLVERSLKIAN